MGVTAGDAGTLGSFSAVVDRFNTSWTAPKSDVDLVNLASDTPAGSAFASAPGSALGCVVFSAGTGAADTGAVALAASALLSAGMGAAAWAATATAFAVCGVATGRAAGWRSSTGRFSFFFGAFAGTSSPTSFPV